ncbi:MAG: hypothetical protein K2K58_09900 [Muribaculaceae bacterium]|nr:hypothetical protein [Muribaculaceae bacterium]
MSKYDDIINLPHYEPVRKRMPMKNRAAQFAPFAALTGHEDAIMETARFTDKRIELSDYERGELSKKILHAYNNGLEVSLEFFKPDKNKEGGSYEIKRGKIKRIEETEKMILMQDGASIWIEMISGINIFD